jgi:hypothetical protein
MLAILYPATLLAAAARECAHSAQMSVYEQSHDAHTSEVQWTPQTAVIVSTEKKLVSEHQLLPLHVQTALCEHTTACCRHRCLLVHLAVLLFDVGAVCYCTIALCS